jgi:hypothetical protein
MNYSNETSAWLSELQSVLDKIAESPKSTVAASTFSTAAGVATAAQWLTGMAAGLAVFAGLIATIILARLNWLKGEQAKQEIENQRLRNQVLRKKAVDLGIEIEDDEE